MPGLTITEQEWLSAFPNDSKKSQQDYIRWALKPKCINQQGYTKTHRVREEHPSIEDMI